MKLENPEKIVKTIKQKCEKLKILGRILVGKEGINAAFCAIKEKVREFENFLEKHFGKLFFKEQDSEKQVYHKLVVRKRDEIIVFGESVDLAKKGEYIEPEKLHEIIKNNEDYVIIDARNDYEYRVGRFKGAKEINIKNFRDFSKNINKIKNLKEKKIITYCTGGIRCEKATAFLKSNGFDKTYQLHGGVINYLEKYPKGFFEGACFVFDDRVTFNTTVNVISRCDICNKKTDRYLNCHNMNCDKLFLCCKDCEKEMKSCCSKDCMESKRQRKEKKKVKVIGKVLRYFRKPKVAEVKLGNRLERNQNVEIKGRTTDIKQKILEIRDQYRKNIEFAKEGMIISFPVKERVRKNDLILIKDS